MGSCIRLENPWGRTIFLEGFVEVSAKVRVWNRRNERLNHYRRNGDAGRSQVVEMPFIFDENRRPRDVTTHIRWHDLRADQVGKGVIQIQAWARYRLPLPALMPGTVGRLTAGSFGYQASWEFDYTLGQDHIVSVARAPTEVARDEVTYWDGPSLECVRQHSENLAPNLACYQFWLKLLPPPCLDNSNLLGIDVGPISVGGTSLVNTRASEGPPLMAKMYIINRPVAAREEVPTISGDLLWCRVEFAGRESNLSVNQRNELESWVRGLQRASNELVEAIANGHVPIQVSREFVRFADNSGTDRDRLDAVVGELLDLFRRWQRGSQNANIAAYRQPSQRNVANNHVGIEIDATEAREGIELYRREVGQ